MGQGLYWSSFFNIWISKFSRTICWKNFLSPLNYFCTFVKKELTKYVWVSFWLCILFPWSGCLSWCQSHSVLIIVALQQILASCSAILLNSFFLKVVSAILGPLYLTHELLIILATTTKKKKAVCLSCLGLCPRIC